MKALFLLFIVAACGCQGCSASQQQQAVGPTIATVACILNDVGQCVAAQTPWPACVAKTIADCGTDAVSIGQVWAAHRHAEVVEGVVSQSVPGEP